MKKLLFILLIAPWLGFAQQVPQAINYQAVARDDGGQPIPNQSISILFEINSGGPAGPVVYEEYHQTSTNSLGLFDVQIGRGNVISGNFSAIDWGLSSYFVTIYMDENGGGAYDMLGSFELISVPYALYAETAGNASIDTDDQILTLSNDTLYIQDGNYVVLPPGTVDTDDQQLTLSNDTLYLQDGGYVVLPPSTDAQQLTLSNDTLYLQNGGFVLLPADNDDQTLTLSNDTLYIQDGNYVVLPPATVDTDDQHLSLSNDTLYLQNGGYVVLPPSTDEQTLTISNDTIFIEDGNFIVLPPGTVDTDDQQISLSNDTIYLQDGGFVVLPPSSDEQTLSISNDTIFIEDGNFIVLPPGAVDTDDQQISLSNDTIYLQDGGFVILPPSSDEQTLSLSNDTLYIEDGNYVVLPPGSVDTDDQQLSLSNDTLYLQDGGYVVLPPSSDEQTLSLSNDTLSIEDGNYVVLPPGTVDTDDQQISLSNDTIYLQDGGFVVLPPGAVDTDEQDLILSNDTLYIENGNGFVYLENYRDDADANPTNEIQTLSKNATTGDITLSGGGTVADWVDDADANPANEVITSVNQNATQVQINEAGVTHSIDMTPYINDADADPSNELQNLSFNPATGVLTIGNSGSTSVTLPITSGGGDNWGTQSAATDITIDGDGTSGQPLFIAQQGATLGQVLKWDNVLSRWKPDFDAINDADSDPNNELITNASYNPTTHVLSITEAGTPYTFDLSGLSGGDDWGSQVASTTSPITGNGTSTSPIRLINGTQNGHILQWNSSTSAWERNTLPTDQDPDPTNEIQDLNLSGGILTITNNSAATPINLGNFDSDDQQVSTYFDGTSWYVSVTDGGSVQLPSGGGTLDDAYDYGGFGAGKRIFTTHGSVQITGDDGLVVHRNSGLSADLSFSTMSADNVMYFNPVSATFRAGRSFGTEWQSSSGDVGYGSFAVNNQTIAGGAYSAAFGDETEASGSQAFATGNDTEASGQNAFTQGDQTHASGNESAAFGHSTEASGQYSFALGTETLASAAYTFASGNQTEATSSGASSFGYLTRAKGLYAISTGWNTLAKGQGAISAGYFSNARGYYSLAMGYNTKAKSYAEVVIGRYNDTLVSSNVAGWIPSELVFVVGNGTTNNNRNNAISIFKDGRVAINTVSTVANVDPDLKLFVEGVTYGSDYFETGAFFEFPATSSTSLGVIRQDGEVVFHTLGTNSVYVGPNAGDLSATTADNNTALGRNSLSSITGASSNTAVGFQSSSSMSTGINNLSLGAYSLQNHSASNYNTAVGAYALNLQSSGDNNTAVGHKALETTTGGSGNTAIGSEAADDPVYTINQCTFLGFQSNANPASAITNSMALGYQSEVTASNQIRLGDGNITSIGGSAAWTNTSDSRLKKNVSDSPIGLDFILSLRPVSYEMIEGHEGITYTGFIAQEVEQAAQELGYEFSGVDAPQNENSYYGLRYATFTVPLVHAVQEQQEMIEDLKAENDLLKAQMEEMWKRIEALEKE